MLCATGSTDGRHTRQRENGPAQSVGAPLPTACITEMLTGKVMGEGCGVGYVGGIGAPLVHTVDCSLRRDKKGVALEVRRIIKISPLSSIITPSLPELALRVLR